MVATMAMPIGMDYANLETYREADSNGVLVVREFIRDSNIPTLPHRPLPNERGAAPTDAESNDGVAIISLEYRSKLEEMRLDLLRPELYLAAMCMLLIVSGIFVLVLQYLMYNTRKYRLRIVVIGLLWATTLPISPVMIYFLGLNGNFKFNIAFGAAFAVLALAIDMTHTYPLDYPVAWRDDTNTLSYLQHAHQFWCNLFNIVAGAAITFSVTVVFKLYDLSVQTFGESFTSAPIVGTMLVFVLWTSGILFRILVDIRRNIRRLEECMLPPSSVQLGSTLTATNP